MAATLGATLGPDWTARAVIDLVRTRCGPLAPAEEIHAPAAYLATLLRQALAGPTAPACPARATDQARRAQAVEQATTTREHTAAVRAETDLRDTTAVPASASSAASALAALRAKLPTGRRRADRVAMLGGNGPAAETALAEAWPPVAQPGAGLPPGLDG